MQSRCSWDVLSGWVGWLLQCTEWCRGGLGVHRAWYRGRGSSVSSTKKLAFLHLFPVEIVIMLSSLHHLTESFRFAEYGNFVFKAIGEAVIELEMEGSISPVNMRGK